MTLNAPDGFNDAHDCKLLKIILDFDPINITKKQQLIINCGAPSYRNNTTELTGYQVYKIIFTTPSNYRIQIETNNHKTSLTELARHTRTYHYDNRNIDVLTEIKKTRDHGFWRLEMVNKIGYIEVFADSCTILKENFLSL